MTGGSYRVTIINSVPDFAVWHDILSESRGTPRPGLLRRSVFRSVDDPNEVMVELELDSLESARALLSSVDLRDFLDRAGVEVYPPVFIGREVTELGFETK
jgi:hypothetical protein